MNLQKQQGRVSKMCNANNVIPTRRFFLLLWIILFLFLSLFCISACNAPAAAPSAPLPGAAAAVTPESVGKVKSEAASEIIPGAVNETAAEPTEKTAAQFTEEAMPKTEEYQLLLEQFFDDAHVPDTMREQFAQAIYGSAEAQTWLDEYDGDDLDWSLINAVLPSRDGNYPYAENECLYNIGMFYYSGEDFINFKQDRIKAFEWFLFQTYQNDAGILHFYIYWSTGNAPHDIMAFTIGPDGRHHTVQIHCKDYSLRHVITSADEAYGAAYDAFFSTIERQGREAVTTFKQQKLYSPGKEKPLPNPPGGNYWWNRLSSGPMQQDVFFITDLDNNGTEKVIHKGRSISQTKYYDDYQWFQIYESRTDFDNDSISVKSPNFHDDFYGLHSGGNLYDLLPLGSYVVQFWTQEHDGITYCISLQKHELLYTLQIYAVQNGEAGLVRKSLLIDEAQNVEISFWGG